MRSTPAASGRVLVVKADAHHAHARAHTRLQVGTADAAVQETRSEIARDMGEREIISEDNLVGLFGPILRHICLNTSARYSDTRVRACALLSLCKLMCVSSAYCEENLQLLFSVMVSAPEPSIRSNIVVALGDMAFRWTNLTEPWMSHIYALLRDDDRQARGPSPALAIYTIRLLYPLACLPRVLPRCTPSPTVSAPASPALPPDSPHVPSFRRFPPVMRPPEFALVAWAT